MAADYILNWSDGTLKIPFGVAQETTDHQTTSLNLIGRGVINWGETFQENFLHLLENFSSNGTPPLNPTIGQLWYDRTLKRLRVYDGNWSIIPVDINVIKTIHQTGLFNTGNSINMVNFVNKTTFATNYVNTWLSTANSLLYNDISGVTNFTSSIARPAMITWVSTQPTRLIYEHALSCYLSSSSTGTRFGLFLKAEYTTNNGATWNFFPIQEPTHRYWGRSWSGVFDTSLLLGYVKLFNPTSIVTSANRFFSVRKEIFPHKNAPGFTGDSYISATGAIVPGELFRPVDELPFPPGTWRVTTYEFINVDLSLTMHDFGGNSTFTLLGE